MAYEYRATGPPERAEQLNVVPEFWTHVDMNWQKHEQKQSECFFFFLNGGRDIGESEEGTRRE